MRGPAYLARCRPLAAPLLVAVAACSQTPPTPDVIEESPVLPDGCGAGCLDARGDGTAAGEGGADAGGDGTTGDVTGPDGALDAGADAPVETPGPCAVINDVTLPTEARAAARSVFVEPAGGEGYAAGLRVQRGGFDNVNMLFATVDGDAGLGPTGDISMQIGAIVTGGALARDGANWVVSYSSNQVNGFEVYLRRAAISTPAGMSRVVAPVGPAARLSNDTLTSDNARVVATPTGWTVVWRSRNDATGATTLTAAAVSSSTFAVGPAATIPLLGAPGAYDLVADGTRTALVYVDVQASTADANVVQLGPGGAAMGPPVALTTMAHVGDGVAATLRGDELVVAWAEARVGAGLHARRVNLATSAAEPVVDLAALGAGASGPGITREGTTGFALGYRAVTAAGSTARMVRLDSTLAPREASSAAGPSAAGEPVRIAANGDGTFALGWADVIGATTTARVRVMRCP